MILVPFQSHHLMEIELQRKQKRDVTYFADPEYGAALEAGDSFTVFHDGEIAACLGVFEFWKGRGIAWAMFTEKAGKVLPALSLKARRYMKQCRFNRIEAHIDPDFKESLRWCELMGFKRETPEPMPNFSPEGKAHYLYAWTRPCLG